MKLENLLFDAQMSSITIVGFGHSNKLTVHKLNTFCGSPLYASPEVFLGQNCNGPTVDVRSLGVLCSVVTRTLHFMGEDFWKLQQQILGRQYHVPFFMSFECVNLLKKILMAFDPNSRGTLEEIMREPGLNMGQEEELTTRMPE